MTPEMCVTVLTIIMVIITLLMCQFEGDPPNVIKLTYPVTSPLGVQLRQFVTISFSEQ